MILLRFYSCKLNYKTESKGNRVTNRKESINGSQPHVHFCIMWEQSKAIIPPFLYCHFGRQFRYVLRNLLFLRFNKL